MTHHDYTGNSLYVDFKRISHSVGKWSKVQPQCNNIGFKVWWLQSNINYIESNAVHAFVSHFLDHIYIIIVLNNLCVVFIIAMNCSIQSNFEDSSAKISGNHHQIRLMQKDWIREIETIANIFPFKMVDSRAIQMLAQFPHFTHTPFSHPQNGEWETFFLFRTPQAIHVNIYK